MKFSVLMPTYNRGEFIVEAVKSILSQDYVNLELIIKDGGKSIQSLLPNDPRIIYIHGRDRGITQAMNQAMKLASGDIFCWANDDDKMEPGTLDFISKNIGGFQWCYGRILMTNGIDKHYYGENWSFNELKKRNFVPQPAVFWKKEIYKELGEMDETNDLVSDYEYWLRIWSKYPPKFLDRVMAEYTLHSEQITAQRTEEQLNQAKNVQKKYENINNWP